MQNLTEPKERKRGHVYFRNPEVYALFQQAVQLRCIKGRSASDRIEELMAADLRRVAKSLRSAGVELPASVLQQ